MCKVMLLFDLVYSIVAEVEKLKGNLERSEVIEEKAKYILEHSSIRYNNEGLWLSSYSQVGVKQSKEVEVQVPDFLVFTITEDLKTWDLSTYRTLEEVEQVLRSLEEYEVAVVMIQSVIVNYNLVTNVFNSRVIWQNHIFQVEYKDTSNEDKTVLIYDRVQLKDVVIDKFKRGYSDIKVYDILKQCYIHFYIKDVVYSTSNNLLPLELVFCKSELSFKDLDEEEDIW